MWLLGMNLHIRTYLNVPENASERNIVKALPTGKLLAAFSKLQSLTLQLRSYSSKMIENGAEK